MTTATNAETSVIQWVRTGSLLFQDTVSGLTDTALDAPSALPGWNRRSLIAHIAANADALLRLLSWARTGVRSPMYASPGQRTAEIETGSQLPAADLRSWVDRGVPAFDRAAEDLPSTAWSAEVVTAQGRTIPANDIPWLRAREVFVHAVDLQAGVDFAHLPPSFSAALLSDVASWRSARADGPALDLLASQGAGQWHIEGTGIARLVELPVAELAGWLTGRRVRADLASLPHWL